jgi:hypothetical protein
VVRELWAGRLLEWRKVGAQLTAEVSAARYFIFPGRFETVAWCELRERGSGRHRVEVGSFGSLREAQAACEADALRRLQQREERSPITSVFFVSPSARPA